VLVVACTTVLCSCTTDDVMMDEYQLTQKEVLPIEDEMASQLSFLTGDEDDEVVDDDKDPR